MSSCQALDLPILAEGVETAEQAAMLCANGCKYLQGWYFGHPVKARAIDAIAAAERRDAALPGKQAGVQTRTAIGKGQ